MPDINLAAETVRSRVMRRRQRMSYIGSVVALGVIVAAWGVVFVLNTGVQNDIRGIEEDINRIKMELRAKQDVIRQIEQFRTQLASLAELIEGNVYWSSAFGELERLVTTEAVFGSLSGNVMSREFTADVVVPSIDNAADLVASLQEGIDTPDSVFSGVIVKSLNTSSERTAVPDREEEEEETVTVPSAGYAVSLVFTASEKAFSGHDVPSPQSFVDDSEEVDL